MASAVTPIEKVTDMLTELQTKVNDEGIEEAKTYNKFACFCKETMSDKSKAISEGRGEKNSLQTKINGDMSLRDKEDVTISEKVKEIKKLEEDISLAKADRKAERLTYEENEMDLTGAIHGLESAILSMKAAKTAIGFTQLPATVKSALAMARALAPTKGLALLQKDPNDEYGFQGGEVIKTLNDLLVDFKAKRTEVMTTEENSKTAYDTLVENKNKAIENAQAALETARQDKADATGRIATSSEDLTSVAAKLLDDQTYLAALSEKCGAKAALWDKRTQARANELGALTQAITLIKSLPPPEDAEGKSAAVFLQLASQARRSLSAVTRAAPVVAHAPVLLTGRRAALMTMLRQQATTIRSSVLDSLVEHASADPLAKVKKMIQDLIERLLKEAAEEASHKGFCDKEYAMTTMKRDKASNEISETNGELELSEARRAKLGEEVATLDEEIKHLDETLSNATTIRDAEKVENKQAIDDAEQGRKAVAQAIDVLDKYYKTAANEAKDGSFLQVKEDPEAPDAGFDDEYAGAQDGAVGVLGMLDVVKSDFERTIKETGEDEETASQDFNELETRVGMSKATKSETLKSTTSAKTEADATDAKNRLKLTASQGSLDKAIGEMHALDKACGLGGSTAEEKKIARDEEMAGLKSALSILDSKS